MKIERDKFKEMMRSSSMRIVQKVIAVFVVIAGMVLLSLGLLLVELNFIDIVHFSIVLGFLILGAIIIFFGVKIWHWGEFNAKKMVGNYFTTIGVSCIFGAVGSVIYCGFVASPVSPTESYFYLGSTFFGIVGIVSGSIMAIEREKPKEMMSSSSMRVVRKVIAVFVVIAGIVPIGLGLFLVKFIFVEYILIDISTFCLVLMLLILGAVIIFLGVKIWHWGEFSAKKMAGNYFTIIGVSCIIGAIVSSLDILFSRSPGTLIYHLVPIFFGIGCVVIGRTIKRRSKFWVTP